MGNNACCAHAPTDSERIVEDPVKELGKKNNQAKVPSREQQKENEPVEPRAVSREEQKAAAKEEIMYDPVAGKAEEKSGLEIEFMIGGGVTKTLNFTAKPLGMTFDNKIPIVVCEITPGSPADKMGVQLDWEFKKVGGVSLEGVDTEGCIELLKEKSENIKASD